MKRAKPEVLGVVPGGADLPTGEPGVAWPWPLSRECLLALATTGDLSEALGYVLDAATALEGVDCGGVYQVDAASGCLDLVAHRGLSPAFVAAAAHYRHDSERAAVVRAGIAVYGRHPQYERATSDDLAREGLRALAVIPIMREGRAVAALNLASHTCDAFPPQTRASLDALAAQVGAVIARIQAEVAARNAGRNLEMLFDTISDYLFVLDSQGLVLQMNSAAAASLGYQPSEVIGRSVLDLHPPDRREEAASIVAGMLAGTHKVCPVPLYAKDGSRVPVETRVAPGTWNGSPALIGISRDVTERQQFEDALRESRARFRMALENANDAAYRRHLPTDRYDYMSPVIERLVGFAAEEMASMSTEAVLARLHPDDQAAARAAFALLDDGSEGTCEIEYRFRAKCGAYRWLVDRFRIVRDAGGTPVYRAGSLRDVTPLKDALEAARVEIAERKRTEAALRESEEKHRMLFNNELAAVSLYDLDTLRVRDVNPAHERLYGYTRAELLAGMTLHDITVEHCESDEAIAQVALGETIVVPRRWHRKKDGTVFAVELMVSPCDWGGRRVAFAMARDISKRVQAEEALRASEERYRARFERSRDALLLFDGGRAVDCNQAAVELFGYKTREELTGKAPAGLSPALQPDGVSSAEAAAHRIGAASAAGGLLFPWVFERADGALFEAEVLLSQIDRPGQPQLEASVRDVTDRNRAEAALRESEARYRRLAEENARLLAQVRADADTRERLLHEVNHRVKNNLAAIIGLIRLEQASVPPDPAAAGGAILADLEARIGSLATVHGILSTTEWGPVALSDLAVRVVRSALDALPRSRGRILDVPSSPVAVPPKQATALALILNEWATNSTKHGVRPGEDLRVTVRVWVEAGDVCVEYRDNGPGFPAEVLRGKRRNVGLDLVQMLTRQDLRGTVQMANESGAVSRVRFVPREGGHEAPPAEAAG